MVSLTTTVGFRYGSGGHRVFLSILLTFSTLSYFTESKFADESRKKPASVHNYILTNALIFNRLHKKNPAFCVLAATKTGSACHRPCPDARCCECSLQQETEAHVTGHVQMPARCRMCPPLQKPEAPEGTRPALPAGNFAFADRPAEKAEDFSQ